MAEDRAGISTLFFRNGHLLALTIVVSLVAGVSALLTMPRLEDPRILNRNATLLTPFPGASAERVETLVTDPIEEALQEIPEIKTIESSSRAGISVVTIELKDEIRAGENQSVFSEIRDELGDITPLLPPGAGPPELDDKRAPVGFTLIAALRSREGTGASLGMLGRLSEELADRFRGVSGTELVRVYGEPEEEVQVVIEREDLADLGLTASRVAELLASADAKGSAGVLRADDSDVLLEVRGELSDLERIAAVPLVEGSDGLVVRVGDVAEVTRSYRTPLTEIGLTDGKRSVLVAARMSPDVRADTWSRAAKAVLDDFRAAHGSGIEIATVFEQERYTSGRLRELGGNLLAGAIVITFVIWLVMGLRQAVIVASALPMVVSVALFGIQMSGNSLHQMSIFGMIIALGLLIDNAIVVTDEVGAKLRAGKSRPRAVAESLELLTAPLMASTFTTVLAFAPILLLPGNAGDFVGSIGQSVIYAVVISLALSLTVVAALAGRFVRAAPGLTRRWWRDGLGNDRLGRGTERVFAQLFRAPVAAIAIAALLPGSGFLLSQTLGREFFPPVDRDMFHVQVWMPSDSSIENTREQAERAERVIREFDDVERVHWLVGGSFPSVWYNLIMDKDSTPSYAQGIVETRSWKATKRVVPALQARLDRELPGAQIVARSFGQGPPVVADIEYRILGPDLDELQTLGEQARLALQSRPDVLHTQMTIERAEPKLWIDADEDEARLAGLSLSDISSQVSAAYEGATGGTVLEQLEEMPVRVRLADYRRGDLSAIASTPLATPEGGFTPLPAFAEVELRPTQGTISRYNRERANTVKAYTPGDVLPIDISGEVLAGLRDGGLDLPPGYRIDVGGAAEQDEEATGKLMKFLPVLVVLAVATLVLSFRSVLLAGVLGLVAAQSVGLAFLSTWAIDFPISFNTILGTLGLIGVAINDSIVVMASIRAHPVGRTGDPAGIADAVMGCMRHVISTTLTTIGGFLPLLLFVGGDFWPSLSIVMAGGIGGATLLAVLFVPAAYRLVVLATGEAPTPAVA